jgi:hypothetical protein
MLTGRKNRGTMGTIIERFASGLGTTNVVSYDPFEVHFDDGIINDLTQMYGLEGSWLDQYCAFWNRLLIFSISPKSLKWSKSRLGEINKERETDSGFLLFACFLSVLYQTWGILEPMNTNSFSSKCSTESPTILLPDPFIIYASWHSS